MDIREVQPRRDHSEQRGTSSGHLQLLLRLPPYRRVGASISCRRTRTATKPPSINSDRIVRELGHEVSVRMSGRTRGKTRAMRDSHYSMGLMSHAALARELTARIQIDEVFREHTLPKPEADLPTAPVSDLPTPSTIAEAEALKHADIWRGSSAREFSGLLQAHTFGPA